MKIKSTLQRFSCIFLFKPPRSCVQRKAVLTNLDITYLAGHGWTIIDKFVQKQQMENLSARDLVLQLMTYDYRGSVFGFVSSWNLGVPCIDVCNCEFNTAGNYVGNDKDRKNSKTEFKINDQCDDDGNNDNRSKETEKKN